MKTKSSTTKLFSNISKTICLTAGIAFLSTNSAIAQVAFQSTATFSGTVELPRNNPNFNQGTTRVDTDKTGAYYRNGKLVYQSKYVKSTVSNGKAAYYVDFKGIPVVSLSGTLKSSAFKDPVTSSCYQGQFLVNAKGVVQDEFEIIAYYSGTVTDAKAMKSYSGDFILQGYGPRYSDANGGQSPTVFDFKSDIPGKPTVQSVTVSNVPISKFSITQIPTGSIPCMPKK